MSAHTFMQIFAATSVAVVLAFSSPASSRVSGSTVLPETSQRRDASLMLSIGVESGDTVLELSGASSALRLSNGEIVVANSGTSQLRWYNAAGKFVRAVGRRGQGPEEFGGSIFIYDGGADTIVVIDQRNKRFHYLTAAGRFVRIDTVGDRKRLTFIYDRTVVLRAPRDVDFNRLRLVAAGIPARSGAVSRRAIPDRSGNLWLPSQRSGVWEVYGAAGRLVGTVTLPPSFEPHQISESLVLGRHIDSLGVERIQLRQFTRAAPTAQEAARDARAIEPRKTYDADSERTKNAKAVAMLLADLRNLATAQEAHFAQRRRYALATDSLSFRASTGVLLTVVQSGPRGYWLVSSSPGLRTTCVFATGDEWPMGSVQGCG